MRRPNVYSQRTKRILRAAVTTWRPCGARRRRSATRAARTVITRDGPLHVTHGGYRCADSTCPPHPRADRRAAAAALALPGLPFGLDCVRLGGQRRLAHQQTLDQAHQAIQARRRPCDLTIARRETRELFAASCTLIRAAPAIAPERVWHDPVPANGGLILSIDGMQPDKRHATV